MNIPLQIAFPDFPPSDAVAAKVRERVRRLEKFYNRITGCHVTVGYVNKKHHTGNLFYATIELSVPGNKIVHGRAGQNEKGAHKDVYVTLRDGFDAIERRLQDYVRVRKPHFHYPEQKGPSYGRVKRVILESPTEGYGFLERQDGEEVYFNSHSVLQGQFSELKTGSKVRFAEEIGDNGLQASTVEVIAA